MDYILICSVFFKEYWSKNSNSFIDIQNHKSKTRNVLIFLENLEQIMNLFSAAPEYVLYFVWIKDRKNTNNANKIRKLR